MVKEVYVLAGKEIFLKKEFVQELRKKSFPPPNDASMNYQEFTAGKEPISRVLDFLQSTPFLSEKRLAVLWDADDLKEPERDILLNALDELRASAVLAISLESSNVKKDAFLAALTPKSKTITCHPPFDKDLPLLIRNRLKKKGLTIDTQAIMPLVERAGRDVAALDSSFESLAVYIHPRLNIELKDVQSLLGRSAEEDVFLIMDDLVRSDAEGALRRIEGLLRDGGRAFEIVAVLAGQYDKLHRAASLLRAGISSQEIGTELRVHSFFLDKFMRQVQGLSEERLESNLRALLECDESIKTGQAASERLALEFLILTLASSKPLHITTLDN